MFKKILIVIGMIAAFALLGGYFYFANSLQAQERQEKICKEIRITIKDSLINNYTDENEIRGLIRDNFDNHIGAQIDKIDYYGIEKLLNNSNAIKKSEVYITNDGTLCIDVIQRRAIVRIIQERDYYIDEEGYTLTLKKGLTPDLPIIKGSIPVNFRELQRGLSNDEDEKKWISKVVNLAKYLEQNSIWDDVIDTFVVRNNTMKIVPSIGEQSINFGTFNSNEIDGKFQKLEAFYTTVIPNVGWDRYSSVDLQFKDQIVCK